MALFCTVELCRLPNGRSNFEYHWQCTVWSVLSSGVAKSYANATNLNDMFSYVDNSYLTKFPIIQEQNIYISVLKQAVGVSVISMVLIRVGKWDTTVWSDKDI